MEYISINNYDSELYNKKKNIKIILYNIIYFNIKRNGTFLLKKRAIKKIAIILVFLLINHIILIFIQDIKINLLDDKYPNHVKFNEFSLSNFFKNLIQIKKYFLI